MRLPAPLIGRCRAQAGDGRRRRRRHIRVSQPVEQALDCGYGTGVRLDQRARDGRHAVAQGLGDAVGGRQQRRRQVSPDIVLCLRYTGEEPEIGLQLVPWREHGETTGAALEEDGGIGEDGEGRLRHLPEDGAGLGRLGTADCRHEHLEPRIRTRYSGATRRPSPSAAQPRPDRPPCAATCGGAASPNRR